MIQEGYQLSPEQELISKAWPAGPANARLHATIRIEGKIERPALQAAWGDLVQAHESLRSFITSDDGASPLQVVKEPAQATPEQLLSQGTLAELTELHPDLHDLRLNLNPLFADSRSLQLLMQQLAARYQEHLQSSSSPLPQLDVPQLADVAQWQRSLPLPEQTPSPIEDTQSDSWTFLSPFESRPAHPLQEPQFQTLPDALQCPALPRLAEQLNRGHLVILVAAWLALAYRSTHRSHHAVAAFSTGLPDPDLHAMVGPLQSLQPIQTRISGSQSFSELVAAVAGQMPPWDGTVPFHQAGFPDVAQIIRFRQLLRQETRAGSVVFKIDSMAARQYPARLELILDNHPDGCSLNALFDPRRFAPEALRAALESLHHIMTAAALAPDVTLDELECADNRRQSEYLAPLISTQPPPDDLLPLLKTIDRHAATQPDAPAVACGDASLTYAELKQRSDALAAHLRSLKHPPETPIALCLSRSPGLIAGILGTMKAGHPYLPLDPGYPPDRIGQILAGSQAPVLVTNLDSSSLPNLPKAISLLALDKLPQPPRIDLPPPSPGQLAYLIYTSGSTGTPKGVAVTHANLSFSTWARQTYYQKKVSAFLMVSSYSFDSSVAGIFWTLCDGGKLVLPEDGLHQDPQHLARCIRDHQVSHLLCLPSLYRHILDQPELDGAASLSAVIVAGESCPPSIIQQHATQLPDSQLFNEYGPTEGTVWATVSNSTGYLQEQIDRQLAFPDQAPIGTVIPGARVYLLDSQLRPLPVGVIGEIHVGGPGVAQGYFRQPDLTAERFLPDPFDSTTGARIYRTGDLARLLPDGQLQFLGRKDHQVKIRGHRIELEEIEARLQEFPEVAQAAVTAKTVRSDELSLVAYITWKNGTDHLDALRNFARIRLPSYMFPSSWMELPALPQMPNGKIDRQALPDPEPQQTVQKPAGNSAAASDLEDAVLHVFQEVLRNDTLSPTDNFFDLGGHSLLAIQAMTRLRSRFGAELPMKLIFEAPTARSLTSALGRPQTGPTGSPAPSRIRKLQRKGSAT